MIKNLDEAIQHCLEVAERNKKDFDLCFCASTECDGLGDCRYLENGKEKGCLKCADEHRQLAEWLKELKNIYGFIEKYPSTDAIYIGDIKDILKGEI